MFAKLLTAATQLDRRLPGSSATLKTGGLPAPGVLQGEVLLSGATWH